MRVKIFIDFWNFQLAWNTHHRTAGETGVVKIPWKTVLPEVLLRHIGPDTVYAGTHVYASVDPATEKGRGLSRFLHAMDGFPGYDVEVKERKPSGPFYCTNEGCRKPISVCPSCNKAISRTVEKGVDSALVTDLIRMGVDDIYDRAILLSGDADFVPAVEFLVRRMKRVTHVGFRFASHELRNACWDHLMLEDLMPELRKQEE